MLSVLNAAAAEKEILPVVDGSTAMPAASLDALAMIARHIDVAIHGHHAVQIVVSLDGTYDASLNGRRYRAISGFITDSEVPHACASANRSLLVISVDASTERGRALRSRALAGHPYRLLTDVRNEEDVALALSHIDRAFAQALPLPFETLIAALSGVEETPRLDGRVEAAIRLIRDGLPDAPRLGTLAARIGLSERRLRDVFRSELGIPMRRFVLWQRVKTAFRLLSDGVALSEVAARSGFADQAHLTRTFKAMFGVPPAVLHANARFLTVFAG